MYGTDHMPASWVPDWLCRNPTKRSPNLLPALIAAENAHSTTHRTLQILSGEPWICVGQLEEPVSSYMVYALIVFRLLALWLTLMIQLIQSSTRGLLKIFKIHTSQQTSWSNTHTPACLLQTFACIVKKSYLEAARCGKSEDLPETCLDTTRTLRNAVIARRFATTDQHGYMCPVPFWVKSGDVVLMFMSGEFLYLLRLGSSGSY